MRNNTSGIFEVIWFVLGGLMLFIAVDLTMDSGIGDSWFYYLLSGVAFILYFIRRRMRMSQK